MLTQNEERIIDLLDESVTLHDSLPLQGEATDDRQDFGRAIRNAQNIIWARVAYGEEWEVR